MEVLTRILYLSLALASLLACYTQVSKYLEYPKGAKVKQVPPWAQDLPNFAICPQPSLNTTALKNLSGFNRSRIESTCAEKGCSFLEEFGHLAEQNNMSSDQVLGFYHDLKFRASEILYEALVVLKNDSTISIDLGYDTFGLPVYELVDCPVILLPTAGTITKLM